MYIFDTSNAIDGSFVDATSSSHPAKTASNQAVQPSVLNGGDFNFPKNHPKTLTAALLRAAESRQSIVFVDDSGAEKNLAYRQLLTQSLHALASLQAIGATPGKAVILQLDGLNEFLISFWACVLGGMVPVPVLPFRNANPDDSSFHKLQTITDQLDNPIILMSDHNAGIIEKVSQQVDINAQSLLGNAQISTFSLIAENSEAGVIYASKTNDIAFLQYTSGSTSFPKGAQITHANVLATVQGMMLSMNVDQSSVMLNWMPYYHDMGIIAGHIMAVVSTCKVVAMKPFTFVRRPLLWLEKMAEHRATITFSPNFGLKRILEKAKPAQLTHLDLRSLRTILNGAEPISIQTCHRFVDLLHIHCGMKKDCLVAGYGLAEASLAVSIAPANEVLRTHILNRDKLGCGDRVEHIHAEDPAATYFADEGPVVAGMELRVVDDHDKVLPVGCVGHVQIKGRSVTQGYFANASANKASFCGKWFRTGDLGFVYDDRFVITGRVKDVVFANGQNYYSHDFEHACEHIEGLDRLVVIGHFDHARNEEDIIAFIACNSKFIGAREKTAILRATQMRINQSFDVTPTMFVLLKSTGEIPKTTSGKIMRHKLLEKYIEGNFSNQCIHISELLEIAPDLSTESDSGKHVTIAEFKLLIRSWWSEVLGISDNAIGDHDPFYSLGGTSIKAIEVLSLAEESVDCLITHDMFKEYDTIDGLANFIVRGNVSVRCKANKLVRLAPYREDLRKFDVASEQVRLDAELDEAANAASYITQEIREDDVAIIGMGCVFPQADTVDAFWQLLREGRDCITEFPSNRCNINQYYEKDSQSQNHTVSKWGSFIENHHFDPKFFSVNENEALTMDPHQRVFLNAAWQAIQDSGLVNINGTKMGVFVGASGTGFYQQQEDALLTPSTLTGALANLAAARVSNAFNLKGPSLSVDTACSSSLVSVDLAVKSILNGESDTAVAGGVQIIESVVMYLMFSRAGILSPEGRCFTFSEKANGFVPGEGAGAVVLKRYRDAVRDGDRVYAVISASATNNDGASLGIMSPNPEGQESIIRTALQQAEVNPEDIGYVEAHGTGTNIGDLIEVRSLSLAFNENHEVAKQSCAIGSVKTNLGHQLAAAGIAGLMKAALSVYHSEIPASLHCEAERKDLKLKDTPFYINHTTRPWPERGNGKPRLAAVNSFGFGGTNAHVILSSAYHTDVRYQTTTTEDEPQVYCLSAKSELSLEASRQAFAAFAQQAGANLLAKDVAYSYSARRDHYRQNRIAIVANSLADAAKLARGEKIPGASMLERRGMSPTRCRSAWLFSGQGSQHPAMGKALYRHEPVFRNIVNTCDEIAAPVLGLSLRELLLSSSQQEEVSATAVTQPLVFTMDYALARLWQSWGLKPDFMLGHSIGEYVAACFGGVFALEDALKIVVRRGALMGSMPAGCGMTAVLQSAEDLLAHVDVLDLPLDVAAYNGPMSTVLSGDLKVLAELHARLDENAVVYQPLSVSHAFHSRHMEPMLGEFKAYISGFKMSMPSIPVVSNVSGRIIEADELNADYWAKHIRQPVQFYKGVQSMAGAGAKMFLEVGAQGHLAGLARRIINTKESLIVTSTPKHEEGANVDNHIAHARAQLYVNGANVDWNAYFARHGDRRMQSVHPANGIERRNLKNSSIGCVKQVSVPTYALERRSMFRMVGGDVYPFAHLFEKTAAEQYAFVPDATCALFVDHVVCRTPMLSGAGQCDLISHLHAQSYHLPPKSLRKLSFHQPWLSGSKLSVSFTGKTEKEFVVADARGNPVFKGYADAFTHDEVPRPVLLADIGSALAHTFTQSALYEIFSSCGVEYGDFHRNIVELKASTTQALATLRPVETNASRWKYGYYLHPGMLDCAFQAVAGIIMAQLADAGEQVQFPTMVPVGIESINNYKGLQEAEYYSHVVLREDSAGNTNDIISCDVCIYDTAGHACASINKLQLRRMPQMASVGSRAKPAPGNVQVSKPVDAKAAPAMHTGAAEFFQCTWQAAPLTGQRRQGSHVCMMFGAEDGTEQTLATTMAESGVSVMLVPHGHYQSLDEAGMLAILEKVESIDSIVYLGDYASVDTGNDAADMNNMRCLYYLLKAISKRSRSNRAFKSVQLVRASRDALPISDHDDNLDIRKSLVTGFLRTARIEFPLLNIRQLNFANSTCEQVAGSLVDELGAPSVSVETLYNSGQRYELMVQPVDVVLKHKRETVFNKDKVFWIIGGTSGVGQLLARHLASNYQSQLVLSGSRKLPARSVYADYIASHDDAIASTIRFIREIEALGSSVTYVSIDVRSADSQRLCMDAIRKQYAHIDGIYFSALQLDDRMLLQKEWPSYRNMIDMRVNGLQELIAQTQTVTPEFFVMFSSLAGITGNIGQSDYAASNVYMDNLPHVQSSDSACRYITVQWGAWELGQQVSDMVREHMNRSGFIHINAQSGMQALEKIILSGERNLAYVPGSLNASQIADSINSLRVGLGTKPKQAGGQSTAQVNKPVIEQTSRHAEGQVMSNPEQASKATGNEGQMQLLLSEFEKQREMLMKLCDSQNALLSSALGNSGLPVQGGSYVAPPERVQPQAVHSQVYASAEPVVVQAVATPEQDMVAAVYAAPVPDEVPAPAAEAAPAESAPSCRPEKPTDLFGYVRSLMAKAVEMDESDIDPDQNIMELGADSMTAMSMVKEMETLYNIELPATLLFEYSTLNELVDFLRDEIGEV